MGRVRAATRLLAAAVVTLVGAGACALGPRREQAGAAGPQPVSAAERTSGASASPGPDQPDPSMEPVSTAGPTATTTPRPATAPVSATGSTPAGSATAAGTGGCPRGEKQREVEKYLAKLGTFGAVTVDGRQSAADCKAIKKFQQRYGIRPAAGRAGPTTAAVARRLANTDTKACKAGPGTTFCVNLTLQTVWAMRDGKLVLDPTVARTGMAGYRTPPGTYRVNLRNIKEWSDPYEVWLPYWQRFVGGIGFHETTTYLHNGSIGSHGCVNLLRQDARKLWDLGRVGTKVHVFGRRPGT